MDVKICRDENIHVEFVDEDNGMEKVRRIYSIDIPIECKELDEKYPEAVGVFFLHVVNSTDYDLYYYKWNESGVNDWAVKSPVYIRSGFEKDVLIQDIIQGLEYEIDLTMML